VVSILEETQDLLCKKLTTHFINLCLDVGNTANVKSPRPPKEKEDADDADVEDDTPDDAKSSGIPFSR
jgi:hypothetical protein